MFLSFFLWVARCRCFFFSSSEDVVLRRGSSRKSWLHFIWDLAATLSVG